MIQEIKTKGRNLTVVADDCDRKAVILTRVGIISMMLLQLDIVPFTALNDPFCPVVPRRNYSRVVKAFTPPSNDSVHR